MPVRSSVYQAPGRERGRLSLRFKTADPLERTYRVHVYVHESSATRHSPELEAELQYNAAYV